MPDVFLTEEFWLAVLAAAVVGATVGMAASLLITAVTSFFSTQHIGSNLSGYGGRSNARLEKATAMSATDVHVQVLERELFRLQRENRELYANVARLKRAEVDLESV